MDLINNSKHIPLIIHQIWYQNPYIHSGNLTTGENIDFINRSNVRDKYKNHMINLVKMNQDMKYILWNNKMIEEIIKEDRIMVEIYGKCKYMIQKIDFAKYVILYKYGGIYIDCDVEPLKPLSGFLRDNRGVVLSGIPVMNRLEKTIIKITSKILNISDEELNNAANNGIIMSSPRHNYWKELFKNCNKRLDDNYYLYGFTILYSLGPKILSETIVSYRKITKEDDVKILDNKYLEPCVGFDMYCKPSEDSYLNHHHEASWVYKDSNKIVDIANNVIMLGCKYMLYSYYFVKRYIYRILVVIIILIILIKIKPNKYFKI